MTWYTQNLHALRNVSPDCISHIESASPSDAFALDTARSGTPILTYTHHASKTPLHSTYDPLREAQQLARTLPNGIHRVIIAGLGCGYHLKELLHNRQLKRIIIYEKSWETIRSILELCDFTFLQTCTHLEWYIDQSYRQLYSSLITASNGFDIVSITLPGMRSIDTDYYSRPEHILTQLQTMVQTNQITMQRSYKSIISNTIKNCSRETPLRILRAAGTPDTIPVIIAGAGPSLDTAIPLLKKHANTFLLLATDSAALPLIHEGIIPHYIIAGDPQIANTRHFRYIPSQLRTSLLLCDPALHHTTIALWNENTVYYHAGNPVLAGWDALSTYEIIRTGGSVTTAAFACARLLTIGPIAFVGQDFCNSHVQTHCRGSMYERYRQQRCNRLTPLQTLHYTLARSNGIIQNDIHNNLCYETPILQTYRQWLSAEINIADIDCVNTSDGGIWTDIPHKSLQRWIQEHCSIPRANASLPDTKNLSSTFAEYRNELLKDMESVLTLLSSAAPTAAMKILTPIITHLNQHSITMAFLYPFIQYDLLRLPLYSDNEQLWRKTFNRLSSSARSILSFAVKLLQYF